MRLLLDCMSWRHTDLSCIFQMSDEFVENIDGNLRTIGNRHLLRSRL